MRYIFLILLLASCGGGSGGSYTNSPPPTVQRTEPLNYGYFGSHPTQLDETKDHVNLYMAMDWDGEAEQIAQMQRAKALGIPNLLYLPEAYLSEDATRNRLKALSALDLLGNVKAAYLYDEPDLAGFSAQQVNTATALARRVLAEFGLSIPLAVIYTGRETYPGIESYDWIGFDAYGEREQIFSNGKYDRLKSKLRPDQRIILVPGGADVWRQDPSAFLAKAQSDPQVTLIMPFIWRDLADPANGAMLGIRSNGLAPAYRAIGKTITGKP